MSNILNCVREGEEIEVKGPSRKILYLGNGQFLVDDNEYTFDNVSFIPGGSGVTPGYQMIARILQSAPEDKTKIRAIYANKSEAEILLRDNLNKFTAGHKDQFSITHVLYHPSDEWKGLKGYIWQSDSCLCASEVILRSLPSCLCCLNVLDNAHPV
ncbi:hypothetical protein BDW59DRAFT_157819 [Aspergillus cavernicola]|uniref:Oxidoreductase FAD/NAD(P)-binding domain-containing protein n=1 Tax=Aspergillus cavernicola TaxID=176166 RepID=A0ABR4IUF3_9EURO